MGKIGIVGNGEDKFTELGMARAKLEIYRIILSHPNSKIVSGHSKMGGIDMWTEEIAEQCGRKSDLEIKAPEVEAWDIGGKTYGYKARNIDIAKSDIVFVIVADKYPENYKGERFNQCYHCHSDLHVKSGACWTGKKAIAFGNKAEWIIIKN
jgi:hypothetical protein